MLISSHCHNTPNFWLLHHLSLPLCRVSSEAWSTRRESPLHATSRTSPSAHAVCVQQTACSAQQAAHFSPRSLARVLLQPEAQAWGLCLPQPLMYTTKMMRQRKTKRHSHQALCSCFQPLQRVVHTHSEYACVHAHGFVQHTVQGMHGADTSEICARKALCSVWAFYASIACTGWEIVCVCVSVCETPSRWETHSMRRESDCSPGGSVCVMLCWSLEQAQYGGSVGHKQIDLDWMRHLISRQLFWRVEIPHQGPWHCRNPCTMLCIVNMTFLWFFLKNLRSALLYLCGHTIVVSFDPSNLCDSVRGEASINRRWAICLCHQFSFMVDMFYLTTSNFSYWVICCMARYWWMWICFFYKRTQWDLFCLDDCWHWNGRLVILDCVDCGKKQVFINGCQQSVLCICIRDSKNIYLKYA